MGRDAEDGKAVVKHKEGKKEGNRKDRRKAAAVDNTFRRTWDKDEFEEKAADREKAGCCSPQEAPLYGQASDGIQWGPIPAVERYAQACRSRRPKRRARLM
jgi:hypothetical protein